MPLQQGTGGIALEFVLVGSECSIAKRGSEAPPAAHQPLREAVHGHAFEGSAQPRYAAEFFVQTQSSAVHKRQGENALSWPQWDFPQALIQRRYQPMGLTTPGGALDGEERHCTMTRWRG